MTCASYSPAERIRRQRRALGLTQTVLAQMVGVEQSTVARWEAGRAGVALRHRLKLAAALHISASILFVEDVAA